METLHSMFEKSACSFAANIAITFNSGAIQHHLRYQELDRQASTLADSLASLIGKRKVVAVYSRQSIELVVCLLGILKNGSCFAPIDVDWPPDVVFRFLSKLSVNHILVEKMLVENFKSLLEWKHSPAFHGNKFELIKNEVLDTNGFMFAKKISSIVLEAETSNSWGLAYIMQSSGTTGEAKAVKVPHCCIVPNIIDIRYGTFGDKFLSWGLRLNFPVNSHQFCRVFIRHWRILWPLHRILVLIKFCFFPEKALPFHSNPPVSEQCYSNS